MSDNKLFGTIHTPPRSYYEPVDTPTIDITISPDRTFKADLTPAVQEAITVNRSKLLILEGLLDQTINDLNALHAKHIDEVNTLLSTINEGDALLRAQIQDNYDKVNNRIAYEINKLGTDITELLTTKVAYLENAIKTLSDNTSDAIAQLKQNLDDEANRLDVRIDDLIAVNDTQHAELNEAIAAEAARAEAAEESISKDVAEFKSKYTQTVEALNNKDIELYNLIQSSDKETKLAIENLRQVDSDIKQVLTQTTAEFKAADAALTDSTVSLAAALALEIDTRKAADIELQQILVDKAPTITGTKAEMEANNTAVNGTLFVIIDLNDPANHLTQYIRNVPDDNPEA